MRDVNAIHSHAASRRGCELVGKGKERFTWSHLGHRRTHALQNAAQIRRLKAQAQRLFHTHIKTRVEGRDHPHLHTLMSWCSPHKFTNFAQWRHMLKHFNSWRVTAICEAYKPSLTTLT